MILRTPERDRERLERHPTICLHRVTTCHTDSARGSRLSDIVLKTQTENAAAAIVQQRNRLGSHASKINHSSLPAVGQQSNCNPLPIGRVIPCRENSRSGTGWRTQSESWWRPSVRSRTLPLVLLLLFMCNWKYCAGRVQSHLCSTTNASGKTASNAEKHKW